jgi:capsular exopolysaccharide synthesis family protein
MDEKQLKESKELQYYLWILAKRKWFLLVFFALVVGSAYLYTQRQPRIYRASSSVIIDRNPPRVLSSVRDVVEVGGESYWSVQDYLKTQFEVIKSLEVTRKVVDRLRVLGLKDSLAARLKKVQHDPETDLALEVQRHVDVEPLADSMLVYIRVEDRDPALAQAIANSYASAYAEFNLEYKRRVIQDAHSDLNQLVERMEKERDQAEKQVLDFEKQYDVGTFENRRAGISTQLNELTRKTTELSIRRVELQARLAQLKPLEKAADVFSLSAKDLLSDGLISEMKKQYLALRSEMLDLAESLGEKHPRMAALQSKADYLEGSIRKEIRARVQATEKDLREVDTTLAALGKQVDDVRQEETRLNEVWSAYKPIQQRNVTSKKFYESVRDRQTETSLSAQVETNNVRVQDLALLPQKPVRPSVLLNMLVGVLIGLFGGAGLAFLIEFMDSTIKTREELEEDFGLVFLGVLPSIRMQEFKDLEIGASKEMITYLKPRSNVSELSRNIRTNLMFISPEKPLHCILITSANPLEGKTTISINVAISMAVSGKRTLVVDTDLRRARVHRVFGLKRPQGLTEFLVRGGSLEDYVVQTPVQNLFLLPAGSVPPNPSELLHSERFVETIALLREKYDFVIFDSPPVVAVTDALIIGKLTDGIVLVVRSRKTTRPALRFVLKELRNINVNIIGVILNDLDLARRRYYYYYRGRYHYYYHKQNYYTADERNPDKKDGGVEAVGGGAGTT